MISEPTGRARPPDRQESGALDATGARLSSSCSIDCGDEVAAPGNDAPVVEGDVIGFYNAGAYGYTMASTFNSRPRPAEVLIYKGKAHLIRQRETLEDLMRGQVEVEIN